MRTTRTRPLAVAVAALGLAVAAWWLVAPQAVGGQMAYLVVRGSSMAPEFGPGDLVVVRNDPPYGPGDVVAYRTPDDEPASAGGRSAESTGGAVIVHRVVAVDGGRLVLRGDANEVDDAIRPAPDDVLGRQVAVVPGAGGLLADVRQHAAGLAAGAAVVLGWWTVSRPQRRRRAVDVPASDETPNDTGAGADAVPAGRDGGDPLDTLAVRRPGPPWLWAILAAVVAVAGVAVVRTPATTAEVTSTPWAVRTTFGWDEAPTDDPNALAVYGDDGLRTGDTVFTSATPVLVVQLASTVSTGVAGRSGRPTDPGAPQPAEPDSGDAAPSPASDGTFSAQVDVVSDAGWRRPVATLAPQALEDGSAAGTVAIDIASAWAVAGSTGSVAGRLGEVRLEIVASTTAAEGVIEAGAVQAFVLDGVSASPIPPEAVDGPEVGELPGGDGLVVAGAGEAGVPGGAGQEEGSAPSGAVVVEGAIAAEGTVPAGLEVGPLGISRSVARALVTLAAGVVLVGGVASVAATTRARRRGEASLIATRYGPSLVALHGAPASMGGEPTEVASFGSLRRVADTVGQPIGVSSDGSATTFWVADGARVWRYCAVTG